MSRRIDIAMGSQLRSPAPPFVNERRRPRRSLLKEPDSPKSANGESRQTGPRHLRIARIEGVGYGPHCLIPVPLATRLARSPHLRERDADAFDRGVDRAPGFAASPAIGAHPAGYACRYCGAPAQAIDHVWPIARGGDNDANNLVPACTTCNSAKGSSSILGSGCPGCQEVRHPSDVATRTGDAFYACRCGSTWSKRWDLQHVEALS